MINQAKFSHPLSLPRTNSSHIWKKGIKIKGQKSTASKTWWRKKGRFRKWSRSWKQAGRNIGVKLRKKSHRRVCEVWASCMMRSSTQPRRKTKRVSTCLRAMSSQAPPLELGTSTTKVHNCVKNQFSVWIRTRKLIKTEAWWPKLTIWTQKSYPPTAKTNKKWGNRKVWKSLLNKISRIRKTWWISCHRRNLSVSSKLEPTDWMRMEIKAKVR